MSHRSRLASPTLFLVIAAAASAAQPVVSEQDKVAAYLESLNLQPLLIDHLSSRMRQADGAERQKIAERLADQYAAMIAATSDPARLSELNTRAAELLKIAPQARAYELRISLLRARYAAAEDGAERIRLGVKGHVERDQAVTELQSVKAELLAIAADLAKKEDSLSRALDGGPADTDRLERELADARRWRSSARYFAGWASLYTALLGAGPDAAQDAQRDFGSLLGAGEPPSAAKVDRALLRFEHIARAAVGVGVSRALSGNDVEALAWLDTVRDEPQADPGTRTVLIRWRITALASMGRWSDLQREVRRFRDGVDQPPAAVKLPPGTTEPTQRLLDPIAARLLAVLCHRSGNHAANDITRDLTRTAVSDLIAQRQLTTVLDLAKALGPDAVAATGGGFIGSYIRGVQQWDRATTLAAESGLKPDEPATSAQLINLFSDAASTLAAAAGDAESSSFAVESASALSLSGRALFKAGKLREAAERFSAAAERAKAANDLPAAEENLALAITTLEHASASSPGKQDALAISERLEQLTTLFVRSYPSSERAVAFTLRSIARSDRTDEQAVRVLEGVGKDSPAYEAARRQLSRLLYRLFREANAADRPFASARFAKVAGEVLAMDRKAALEAGSDQAAPAVDRALVTARQLLDAILSIPSPDAATASRVLGQIEQVLLTAQRDIGSLRDELDFRAVQIAVATGDTASAEERVVALRSRLDAAKPTTEAFTSARRFHIAARRVLLRAADDKLRSAADDQARAAAAARVVAHGTPVIDDLLSQPAALDDPVSLATASRVAEAAAILWRANADAPARDLALRLDRAILERKGPVVECLQRTGELAEAANDTPRAIDAWRTLGSILAPESEPWARAKHELFRLLLATDPPAAKAALTQHLVLNPKGAEPWHGRIVRLAQQAGVTVPSPASGANR